MTQPPSTREKKQVQTVGTKSAVLQHALYISVLLISFAFLYAYVYDSKVDLNGDNVNYIALGKALSSGVGYTNIFTPGQPPHNHFPPGYPVLISLIMRFVSEDFFMIRLFNGICLLSVSVLFFFVFYQLFRSRFVAFLLALLLLFNAHLLRFATMEMSELPFLLLTTLSLLCYSKVDMGARPFRNAYFLASIVLLVASIYVRSLGIALAGAYLLDLITRKKWAHILLFLVLVTASLLPWQLRSSTHGESSYANALLLKEYYEPEAGSATMADFASRVWENAQRYISREIPDLIVPSKHVDYSQPVAASGYVFGIVLICCMVAGLLRPFPTRRLIVFYLAATFLLLLCWPTAWLGVRFMLGLLPILILLLGLGIRNVIVWAKEKVRIDFSPSPFLLLVLFLPYFISVEALHEQAKKGYPPGWMNYIVTAKWVGEHAPQGTIVACRKPEIFSLFSQGYAVRHKFTHDDKALMKDLYDKDVSYVVLDQVGFATTSRYLLPAVQKNRQAFTIVLHLKNPDTYLLKLNK